MNGTGRIVQVTWDTGIHLLRIDMERLTGLHNKDVFEMIDHESKDGNLSPKEWDLFFEKVDKGDFGGLLENEIGEKATLAERSSNKKLELRQLQARQLGRFGSQTGS